MQTLLPDDVRPFFDGIRDKYDIDLRQYEFAQHLIFSLAVEGEAPAKIEAYESLLAPIVCRDEHDLEEFSRDFAAWVARRKTERRDQPPEPFEPTVANRKEGQNTAHRVFYGVAVGILSLAVLIWTLANQVSTPYEQTPDETDPGAFIPEVVESRPLGTTPRQISTAVIVLIPFALGIAGALSLRARRKAYLNTGTAERANRHLLSLSSTSLDLFADSRADAVRMKRWMRHTTTNLDMQRTAVATARHAGLFSPVYEQRAVSRSYLVLIDAESGKDHLPQLWDSFIDTLVDEGVAVDRYFFVGDPRRAYRTRELREPVPLDQLIARHIDAHLLLIGDAAGLVDLARGRLKPWAERLRDAWSLSVVLTPRVNPPWGATESLLGNAGFLVVPSTEVGVKFVAAAMESFAHDNNDRLAQLAAQLGKPLSHALPSLLLRDAERWLTPRRKPPPDTGDLIEGLREYLGEFVFAWLCACAVFPAVSWTVTSYLGERLANRHEQRSLTVNDFALLLTLPWFRVGRIPGYLRLRLVYELQQGSEYDVRADLFALISQTLDSPVDATYLPVATVTDEPFDDELIDLVDVAPDGSVLGDSLLLRYLRNDEVSSTDLEVPSDVLRSPQQKSRPSRDRRLKPAALLAAAGAAAGTIWYVWFEQILALSVSFANWDWYGEAGAALTLTAFTLAAWTLTRWIQATTNTQNLARYLRPVAFGPMRWHWPRVALAVAGICLLVPPVTDWLVTTVDSALLVQSDEIEEIIVADRREADWGLLALGGFLLTLFVVPFRRPQLLANSSAPDVRPLDLAMPTKDSGPMALRVFASSLLALGIYELLSNAAQVPRELLFEWDTFFDSEAYRVLFEALRFALVAGFVLRAIQPVWAPYGNEQRTFLLTAVAGFLIGALWGGAAYAAIVTLTEVVDLPITVLADYEWYLIDLLRLPLDMWLTWLGAAVAAVLFLQSRGRMSIAHCQVLLSSALVCALVYTVFDNVLFAPLYDVFDQLDFAAWIDGLAGALAWYLLFMFGARALTGNWRLPRLFPGSGFLGFLGMVLLLATLTDTVGNGVFQFSEYFSLGFGVLIIAPIMLSRYAAQLPVMLPAKVAATDVPIESSSASVWAAYFFYALQFTMPVLAITQFLGVLAAVFAIPPTITYYVIRRSHRLSSVVTHYRYLMRSAWIFVVAEIALLVLASYFSLWPLVLWFLLLAIGIWLFRRGWIGIRLLYNRQPVPNPASYWDPREKDEVGSLGIVNALSTLLAWSKERAKMRQFNRNSRLVNIIAYENSRHFLQSTLLEIYKHSVDRDSMSERIAQIEESVAEASTAFNKRRVLARALLTEIGFEDLVARGTVTIVVESNAIVDADTVVNAIIAHLRRDDGSRLKELERWVSVRLQTRSTSQVESDLSEQALAEEWSEAKSQGERARVSVRWLLLLQGVDLQWLVDNDFLPEGYIPTVGRLRRGRWRWSKEQVRITRSTSDSTSGVAEAASKATEPPTSSGTTSAGERKAAGQWSSPRLFVFAGAGAVIGVGNIWQFPYIAAESAGGSFIAVYLLCLFVIGVPLMIAETVIGRAGRKSPVNAMRALVEKGGGPRYALLIGWLGMLAGFLIFSYYSVIGSWALYYMPISASGTLAAAGASSSTDLFDNFLASPVLLIAAQSVIVGIVAFISGRGFTRGLQPAIRWLVPTMFVLLVIIAGYATFSGDFSNALNYLFGFGELTSSIIVMAARQAFFTLALGTGAVMIYGSYLPENVSIGSTVVTIALLDILVSLLGGLAVYSLVFSFGLDPASGPGLVFVTLPLAFAQLPLGSLFAFLFFGMLVVMALTSLIAMTEPAIAYLTESFNVSRRRATALVCLVGWVLGLGTVFSFNIWSDFRLVGDLDLFGALDNLTSNIMLPLSGMLIALFVGYGLDRKIVRDQLSMTPGVENMLFFLLRVVTPVAMVAILGSIWFG